MLGAEEVIKPEVRRARKQRRRKAKEKLPIEQLREVDERCWKLAQVLNGFDMPPPDFVFVVRENLPVPIVCRRALLPTFFRSVLKLEMDPGLMKPIEEAFATGRVPALVGALANGDYWFQVITLTPHLQSPRGEA